MDIFISEEGTLKYNNGFVFKGDKTIINIPYESVSSIITYSNISFDSNTLLMLKKYNISLFIFNKYSNLYSLINNESNGRTSIN